MNARAIARIASLLRLARPAERHREDAFRQRLAKARTAVSRWKVRAHNAAAREQMLRAQLSAAIDALREAKTRLAHLRRELPSLPVVEDVFLHRMRTLPARVKARSMAGREEQLLGVSDAYRRALEDGPDALNGLARRVESDGLVWWIPVERGTAERPERSSERMRLPLRGIVQTRDVAGGGIMLDIGANVGRMAIPRVILGDVSAAYCAEPDPVTFACLVRNVVDNGLRGLVLPDRTAIGDGNGTVRLLRTGSSGNFRVVPAAAADARDVVEVPCCTLDAWVERQHIDVDAVTFIKVDVEGFERRLVAGAGSVLGRAHIAWQMEIKPAGLRAAGDEPEALYRDLQHSFTHFVDLNRKAPGARVRPIAELPEAMGYIGADRKTDVLLFCAALGRV